MTSQIWVSGSGVDTNAGTFGAPKRTWTAALAAVSAGGIITALDSADFGSASITFAVALRNGFSSGTIAIAAGATDVVSLSNIQMFGAGSATGVSFSSGGALVMDRCDIENYSVAGVSFTPSGNSVASVSNTTCAGCGGGVLVAPQTGGVAQIAFRNTSCVRSGNYGFRVDGTSANATAGLSGCTASFNSNNGVLVISGAGTATATITDTCAISGTGGNGITSNGAAATAQVASSLVSGNTLGLHPVNSGQIISYGNNVLYGNTSDGSFTGTASLS